MPRKSRTNTVKTSVIPQELHNLPLEVVYSHRRRRTIQLQVQIDKIVVRAPVGTPPQAVASILDKRSSWLRSKIQPACLSEEMIAFEQGDCWPYLGRWFPLASNPNTRQPTLQQGFLWVSPSSPTLQQLQPWFAQQATAHLSQRVAHYQPLIRAVAQELRVRCYRARWGSCSRQGRVSFNTHLIMAPPAVVDYVVVHELAHLHHFNHSHDFWRLVEVYAPKRRAAEQWLREEGRLLLHYSRLPLGATTRS